MSIKEESLQKALKEAGLTTLPRQLRAGDNYTWVSAIVLVRKTNIDSYCLAINNGDGMPIFTHDFGPCRIITGIVSIHPIMMLDNKLTPDLRSDRQIIEYLSKNGYDGNFIARMLDKAAHATEEEAKRDRNTVKMYVTKAAIAFAKKEYEERQRCAAIRNFDIKRYEKEKQIRNVGKNQRNKTADNKQYGR